MYDDNNFEKSQLNLADAQNDINEHSKYSVTRISDVYMTSVA